VIGHRRTFLGQFGFLDDCFDVLLLLSSLLIVTPPNRPFVLAIETEMSAGLAFRPRLVALLSAETACEATWAPSEARPGGSDRGYIPERERRCIFDDAFVGDDLGAMALSDGVADDMGDAMISSQQANHVRVQTNASAEQRKGQTESKTELL
jgi:hypothetical protein